MTSKIEKLEKLLAEPEGKWDWEHEVLNYCEALRNSAPLLLEIVKAAKEYRELYGPRVGVIADRLQIALQKFEESDS